MNPVAPSLSGSSKKLPTFMSNLMSNPPLFVAAVLVFVTIVVALTEAMKKEYQDRVATALATAILDRRRPKKRMIVAGVINDGHLQRETIKAMIETEPDSVSKATTSVPIQLSVMTFIASSVSLVRSTIVSRISA